MFTQYANMRDLATMPRAPPVSVTLGPVATLASPGGLQRRAVTLTAGACSPGCVAFFIRLRALDEEGRDVLPATWSDNFVTILSGGSAMVVLEYETGGGEVVMVTAEPFNSEGPS
jgi:hypothetical protein